MVHRLKTIILRGLEIKYKEKEEIKDLPKLQKQIKVAQYIKDNINAQVNEED